MAAGSILASVNYRVVELIFVAPNPQALVYLHRRLLFGEVEGLHVEGESIQAYAKMRWWSRDLTPLHGKCLLLGNVHR